MFDRREWRCAASTVDSARNTVWNRVMPPWQCGLRRLALAVVAAIAMQSQTCFAEGGTPSPNSAPTITLFEAVNFLDNYWEFRGDVDDEDPAGCVIAFGGLLDGHSVNVNSDGTFYLILELGPNDEGIVSAKAIDSEGLESEVEEDTVVQ